MFPGAVGCATRIVGANVASIDGACPNGRWQSLQRKQLAVLLLVAVSSQAVGAVVRGQ